jgi:hypothetical protein
MYYEWAGLPVLAIAPMNPFDNLLFVLRKAGF